MDMENVLGISMVEEDGRIVIPDAVLGALELEQGDCLEIVQLKDDGQICVKKFGKEVEGSPEYETLAVLPVTNENIE